MLAGRQIRHRYVRAHFAQCVHELRRVPARYFLRVDFYRHAPTLPPPVRLTRLVGVRMPTRVWQRGNDQGDVRAGTSGLRAESKVLRRVVEPDRGQSCMYSM